MFLAERSSDQFEKGVTCLNEGTLDFDPEAQDLAKLASLARPSEERPNIPGYELDRRIGEGSFGEVWSGVQLSTRQKVAVKLLHRTDLGALTYLEREVSRLAHVTEHPNLLTLIDANLQHVPAFLVTPLLSSTLEAYLTQSLSIRTSVKWMREVAEALNYIHHRGILHCDLKPGNLLLDQEGRVRVVDFGQAHLLEQGGGSLGTLWYMPPEQVPVARKTVHPEAGWDIYAYGATFYRLLTGQNPRQSEAAARAIDALLEPELQLEEYRRCLNSSPLIPIRRLNPAVDRDLASIVERCLELNAEHRYAFASDILRDLERREGRYPVLARRRTVGYVARRFLVRNWVFSSMAALTLMAAIFALGELRLARQEIQKSRAQSLVREALLLAEAGSLQPELLLAEACRLDPESRACRLTFSAYLQTQWRSICQIPGNGSQGLLTPDGRRFVFVNSVGQGKVQCYDSTTGHIQNQFEQSSAIGRCSLSATGEWLIYPGEEGRVMAWNLTTGQFLTAARHTRAVRAALLDGADRNCLSSDAGGEVLWSDCLRSEVKLRWKHAREVKVLALSSDGTWAASGDIGGTLQLWNLKTGRRAWTLDLGSEICGLIWQDSAATCWAGCTDGRIYRFPSSNPSTQSPLPLSHGARMSALRMQSNGQIVTWGGTRCRLWDAVGNLAQEFVQREVFASASLSGDGRLLITGNEDGLAQIWDVASGRPAYRPLARPGRLAGVGFFPGDQRFYTASATIDAWDLREVEPLPVRQMHNGRVEALLWHPGGQFMVSTQGSFLWLWDRRGRQLGKPLDTSWDKPSLRWNRQGHLLVQNRGRLRSFEVTAQGLVPLKQWLVSPAIEISPQGQWACSKGQVVPLAEGGEAWSLNYEAAGTGCVADDGRQAALLMGQELTLWRGQGKVASIKEDEPILARFVADGLLWVSAKAVTLYDARLAVRWSRPTPAYRTYAGSSQFPALRRIEAQTDAVGSSLLIFNYQTAEWWDLVTGELRLSLPAVGRFNEGCVSQDGDWVALTGTQGTVVAHRSMDQFVPVPLAPRRNLTPMGFMPTGLGLTLGQAESLSTYPLQWDLESSPKRLLDLAMARTGRGLSGGVEFVLDAKTLKSLREGLRQPRT